MKTILSVVTSMLLCIANLQAESIVYDSKEYKPKGKHYTAKKNTLYYGWYSNSNTDKITCLYYLTEKNVIIFKGLWVSKSLESKLPMVVLKYIGKHIIDVRLKQTHSIQDALNIT